MEDGIFGDVVSLFRITVMTRMSLGIETMISSYDQWHTGHRSGFGSDDWLLHFVVVDGGTKRNGIEVVAIRDPHGTAIFQSKNNIFPKMWLK
uniref:hypothetical protein n=1 Tax=Rhizobium sp. F40D2 TaxID=3453141 RepID=UPI003F28DB8A